MEFPTDENTFALGNQFMFGNSFLVAPKLGEPMQLSAVMNGVYNVTVYLPPSADWYFKDTKAIMSGSDKFQSILVADLEYPTFIKAGSIIPILNFQSDRLSIL